MAVFTEDQIEYQHKMYIAGLLSTIRSNARKDFGERCKKFCYGCVNCGVYLAMDILQDSFMISDKELNQWVAKYNKK